VAACVLRHRAVALPPVREKRFRVYREAPGFRPGQGVRERRFNVYYEEAPGFRPGPVTRHVIGCRYLKERAIEHPCRE
jgi:hypothetical protein